MPTQGGAAILAFHGAETWRCWFTISLISATRARAGEGVGIPASLLLGFYARAGSRLGAGGEAAAQKWVRGAVSEFSECCARPAVYCVSQDGPHFRQKGLLLQRPVRRSSAVLAGPKIFKGEKKDPNMQPLSDLTAPCNREMYETFFGC